MENSTVDSLRVFLRYILINYQFKIRECNWILNYLLSDDKLLEKTILVEDASQYERGVILAAYGTDSIPFCYYSKNIITTDANRAFQDIRLTKGNPLYLQINFRNKYLNQKYLELLFFDKSKLQQTNLSSDEIEYIEALLKETLNTNKTKILKKKIDDSLDKKDKELFLKLTDKLLRNPI